MARFAMSLAALLALTLFASSAHAVGIYLADINGSTSTAANFTAEGVANLTGSETVLYPSITGQNLTGVPTVTSGALTFQVPRNGNFVFGSNPIDMDYLSIATGFNPAPPVTITITGLSGLLSANTTYQFNFIGNSNTGDAAGQGGSFQPTYEGSTPAAQFAGATTPAVFNFTTDGSVGDSMSVLWAVGTGGQFGSFAGFAITVPEPSSFVLGLLGLGCIALRKKHCRA